MNDIQTYEKMIKRKADAKLIAIKIALIAAYSLISALGVLLVIKIAGLSAPLLLVLFTLVALFAFFSWKYTNIEYEYSVIGNEFCLSKIYGKSIRKDIFECELSRAKIIAPYNGEHKEGADRCNPDKRFLAIASKASENVWYVIFEEESGRTLLVFFEADDRAIKIMRHANPRATVRVKPTENTNA